LILDSHYINRNVGNNHMSNHQKTKGFTSVQTFLLENSLCFNPEFQTLDFTNSIFATQL